MIEVLKQSAEDVSKAYDVLAFAHTERALELLAKARTSLRQAIAEAEKQEQGEPVGYLEIDDIESQREYPHNCRNVNLWYESGEGLVAVYTHPPQRKPLTDEQILNVARDHYNPHQRPEISFARAIEAAHGIKE